MKLRDLRNEMISFFTPNHHDEEERIFEESGEGEEDADEVE